VLQRLEVKNFLALRDVSIDLERFTVIVGPNASGKSTILEAIHRVCALRSGQRRVLVEGGDFPNRPINYAWMFPNEILSKNASPIIQWEIHSKTESMKVTLRSETPAFTMQWTINLQIPLDGISQDSGYQDGHSEIFSAWGEPITRILPTSINLRPNGQKMALASYSPLKKPILESDGSGLATVCVNIQQEQPEAFERIQESLRTVIPTIKRFRFRRTDATRKNYVNGEPKPDWTGIAEELIFDFDDATDVSAKYVSEGTLLALCVLTAAARFEGEAVLLIDDLERGLHPKAVHDLVKTLRKLQEVNPKLQIVATSHSPYVLDELQPQEIRVVTRDPEEGTIVGHLSDHPNFEKWKDAMLPGEFWSRVGEDWLLRQKQNA
jgi:energy-coupling factor transporter ATP-binding protein EcfA2